MSQRLHSDLHFAQPQVSRENRADGSILLRSPLALGPYPRALGEWLVQWANKDPHRTFLAERAADTWRKVSYAATLVSVRRIGESLLARGLSPARPEDFKLMSGTWVHVGAVRVKLIAACDPLVQDAVITGHDREEMGALVFVNPAAAKALGLDAAGVRTRLQAALGKLHAESTGSSTAPVRLLVMEEPPSIDANEITDKGYINQRAVLERRAALVEKLHSGGPEAIAIGRQG